MLLEPTVSNNHGKSLIQKKKHGKSPRGDMMCFNFQFPLSFAQNCL